MGANGEETKIPVVDDDPDVRFILKETLKKIGYEVQAVESGWEGLEAKKWSICDHRMTGRAQGR